MKTAHDLVEAAKAHILEIPIEQAGDAIRTADVLIDVREADEYQAGHIPGAIHAYRGVLEFKRSSTAELAPRDLKMVVVLQNQRPRCAGRTCHAGNGLPASAIHRGGFWRLGRRRQARSRARISFIRLTNAPSPQ